MQQCGFCDFSFAVDLDHCPHCARPSLFPNVTMANLDIERETLEQRYENAIREAADQGCEDRVRDFESSTDTSKAVIAQPLWETLRLASGDHQVYSTYPKLVESETKVPDGSKWDALRRAGEPALFGAYTKEIRFGALTLDGMGVKSYGECFWILRDDMIAHRASVFEENALTFMDRHRIEVSKVDKIPAGYRAPWEDRSKLCVAKLGSRINGKTSARDFPELLMTQGQTSEDDDFVEVHIGGPMTVRTFERVILNGGKLRRSLVKTLQEDLERFEMPVEGDP